MAGNTTLMQTARVPDSGIPGFEHCAALRVTPAAAGPAIEATPWLSAGTQPAPPASGSAVLPSTVLNQKPVLSDLTNTALAG